MPIVQPPILKQRTVCPLETCISSGTRVRQMLIRSGQRFSKSQPIVARRGSGLEVVLRWLAYDTSRLPDQSAFAAASRT
jgi:hypothetical protein